MATSPRRTFDTVDPPPSYRFSGAHARRTIRSRTMATIAFVTAVLAAPTMPIFVGYILGSISIVCASVVLGRNGNRGMTDLSVGVAWASLAISLLSMIGYLTWMLAVSPNYWD